MKIIQKSHKKQTIFVKLYQKRKTYIFSPIFVSIFRQEKVKMLRLSRKFSRYANCFRKRNFARLSIFTTIAKRLQ